MYINAVRKRSGLGITIPYSQGTMDENTRLRLEAEEAWAKRRTELFQKELLARTKILADKYGPMNAYKIIKGFMTEEQAAAEQSAKLAARKAEAGFEVQPPGGVVLPVSVTVPKTITPGTADGAAAGKTKISLTWILIGLAAILFGPKLLKQTR